MKLTTLNITHNHHRYTRDMQNITVMRGEFRMYPNALEKALLSSNGSK